MRPHYCMKNSSRQDEKNRVKWEHGFWELIRNFLFSTYNRRSRIFEVPIWHLKNTRARKKGWTRWQTYATVCIGLNREQ